MTIIQSNVGSRASSPYAVYEHIKLTSEKQSFPYYFKKIIGVVRSALFWGIMQRSDNSFPRFRDNLSVPGPRSTIGFNLVD
jgi:hypothetical protein